MKKLLTILIGVMAAVALLVTCRKAEKPGVETVDISYCHVEPYSYSADLTLTYAFISEIKAVEVKVSESKRMKKPSTFVGNIEGDTVRAALTDLKPQTLYYYQVGFSNGLSTSFTEIDTFRTLEYLVPQVVTYETTDITQTTATGRGEVLSDCGTPVTERGICWSLSHNPTLSGSHIASGDGVGRFEASLDGLTGNKTYYVRAYAINGSGTAYGNEVSFLSGPVLPTVVTNAVTDVTIGQAVGNGEVVSDGGAEVTERGFCWSRQHNPTLQDAHVPCGSGVGAFSNLLEGLEVGATYYVKAYAINTEGTAYGQETSFTTPSGPPEVVTYGVTDIFIHEAKLWGQVVREGGSHITERGFMLRTEGSSSYDIVRDDGLGLGIYIIFKEQLMENTTYFVKAYATNTQGTSYGEELPFYPSEQGAPLHPYTVGPGKQVIFARGNLQYQASTDTWRFAPNQYETIDEDNLNIGPNYNGWIDLFGWGTSGYNNKYPYMVSPTDADYGDPDCDSCGLIGTEYDWGYHNAISNGGNQPGIWRIFTEEEFFYLMHYTVHWAEWFPHIQSPSCPVTRAYTIQINGKSGLLMKPDDWVPYEGWDDLYYLFIHPPQHSITLAEWTKMTYHGVLFLPATGYRYRNHGQLAYVDDDDDVNGHFRYSYWTGNTIVQYSETGCYYEGESLIIWEDDYDELPSYEIPHHRFSDGMAVRLVRDYQP